MMQIAIIADTHMPKANRHLPAACIERLRRAELILHIGDFVRVDVLREIEAFGEVVGVYGNMDEPRLRELLPGRAEVEPVPGIKICLVHNGGPGAGRLERLHARFPEANAVIFGHSHIPLHATAPDGFQIFNPGSPTERRKAPNHTMGIATIGGGRLTFELITLD